MGITRDDVLGRWQRLDDGDSTTPFPREVEFFPDRTYRATGGDVRHPVWDEASYDVLDDGSVRIATAYDRKVTYAARIDEGVLTLTAGEQRVRYRRATPEPDGT